MARASRRQFLAGGASTLALALAGCSADGDGDPTSRPVGTATDADTTTTTRTPTPTPTPRAPAEETVGFEAMLERTPTHPEMADDAYVWARYVDTAALLADVGDDQIGARLRREWLGAGPPQYGESTAFELVHVQPGALANVTVGRGAYDADAAVEGMVDDGWRRLDGGTEAYSLLAFDGFAAAVGDRRWVVVSEPDTDLVASLAAAVAGDPLADRLGRVDTAAMDRAAGEAGNYLVVQRSVASDYAAGIAVDYEPYRYPRGVMHYATGRESPSWQRVERRFRTQIAGEIQAVSFGEDFG
mgnify:CR=1 FL=1